MLDRKTNEYAGFLFAHRARRVAKPYILRDLAGQLRAGAHVVTHCRAGIGRASLLAASLLILNGVDPDTAWNSLEHARELSVPDTDEQREWTLKLLEHAVS
ncbi:hypothetical protein [Streptomyces sp. NPDC019890]|uniref:hypothetical protein n=1 Tax=Streptomyces sp. NPDC019890 TaxID=3365064 RepID=UPI00384D08A2